MIPSTTKPVEENVTLRGERMTVERRQPIETTTAPGDDASRLRNHRLLRGLTDLNHSFLERAHESKKSLSGERPPSGPKR
jgi:hypothetical protein